MQIAMPLPEEARAQRSLRAIGTAGAVLTVAIVAASALLRLSTEIRAGEAVSLLPDAVEQGARIAHRLSAMAVGVLAAAALVVAARYRPMPPERAVAALSIVGLTLLLATIGRHTPGYRVMAVTVANVAGGTLLACAFWWLREQSRDERSHLSMSAFAALVALVSLAAVGAGMSALAMHGEHSLGPVHQWAGTLLLALVAAAAWHGRSRGAIAAAAFFLALAEWSMGFLVPSTGEGRSVLLPLAHAVGSCVLALLLVSLAVARERSAR